MLELCPALLLSLARVARALSLFHSRVVFTKQPVDDDGAQTPPPLRFSLSPRLYIKLCSFKKTPSPFRAINMFVYAPAFHSNDRVLCRKKKSNQNLDYRVVTNCTDIWSCGSRCTGRRMGLLAALPALMDCRWTAGLVLCRPSDRTPTPSMRNRSTGTLVMVSSF